MDAHGQPLSIGFPRIRNEPGEVRDFPPSLIQAAAATGTIVRVESGYGSGLGFRDDDYASVSPRVEIVDRTDTYASGIVVVLRPSRDSLDLLHAGATFMAMLHFPTHRERARALKEQGVDAIALDLIVDDEGVRLVEDMRAVAWNGLDVAFDLLARIQPAFRDPRRAPTRVTVIGAGMVGKHAVEAATKFGSLERAQRLRCQGLPGVEVTTIGRNLSANETYMRWRLRRTDVLVDASRRSDAARPLIPNAWLEELPTYAVIADLSVDHYLVDDNPPVVRGIEGIPAGDLVRYVFSPRDAAWDRLARDVSTDNRRWVVSCYGWPGLKPFESATHYGRQLEPFIRELIRRGGGSFLRPTGSREERALFRASLAYWIERL